MHLAADGSLLYACLPQPAAEPADPALVLRLIFMARELLAFGARSRTGIESRGRRGGGTDGGLAAGTGSLLRQGADNPAPLFTGPLAEELARRVWSAPSDAQTARQPDSHRPGPADRLLVHPDLLDIALDYFSGAGGRYERDWFEPGLLRPGYSVNEDGVEPTPDFFDRLRRGTSEK